MELTEMHVWFRQYAQQMGMQNVRTLLPEQIDLLINTSIIDIVNQIIVQNIGITNDRIITDNSKIGQINALKTLYTVKSINVFDYSYSDIGTSSLFDSFNDNWTISWENDNKSISFSVGAGTQYDVNVNGKTNPEIAAAMQSFVNNAIINKYHEDFPTTILFSYEVGSSHLDITGKAASEVNISIGSGGTKLTPTEGTFRLNSDGIYKGLLRCNSIDISYLYLVDFAIDYKKSSTGMKTGVNGILVDYDSEGFTSKYFPVRLIDDAFLADTLNDFILSPRLRSPIITINANSYDLYFDKFVKVGLNGYTLESGLVPYTLRVSYIAKPNKVEYRLDKGYATNVECNLPEYLHVDILKHAVDLYRASVTGSLLSQQAQDQAQQREIARNQAIPSDGYNNNR